MRLGTRKLLDRAFSGAGMFALVLMCAALMVILAPMFNRGVAAFIFRETVERRQFMLETFERGDRREVEREVAAAEAARRPVYEMLEEYENSPGEKRELEDVIKQPLRELLGPLPGEKPITPGKRYGDTRWARVKVHLDHLLYRVEYDYSDPSRMGVEVKVPRVKDYEGTPLEPLFGYVKEHIGEMLRPRWTFYWRFWFDQNVDAYHFGGIWAEVLGTLYLTVGAMVVAAPVGLIAAIYLTEYAPDSRFISLLRACISTLAGVPSVVFGLFGLVFFIDALNLSDGKSVMVGALTLALLVLPTVIRASEEALRAVPMTYKEASLSLGATKWTTIRKVILPAALPGIITSVIISMGRAAGETAPILFTAAVAAAAPLPLHKIFTTGTPALPSNIYSAVAEHEARAEILHVPFGMVVTLVTLVLLLNFVAIWLRARISRKLRG